MKKAIQFIGNAIGTIFVIGSMMAFLYAEWIIEFLKARGAL